MDGFSSRLDNIQDLYLRALHYSISPTWKGFSSASKWGTMLWSALGTGYFGYCVGSLPLPALNGEFWYSNIYWWLLIPSVFIGFCMGIGLYIITYDQTKRKIKADLAAEVKGASDDGKWKELFKQMFRLNTHSGAVAIRLTNILGMILLCFALFDGYRQKVVSESEYQEKVQQEYRDNEVRIDTLNAQISKITRMQTNGRDDDDAMADALFEIKTNELNNCLAKRVELSSLNLNLSKFENKLVSQKMDNTAWIRFVSNGKVWLFNVLITLMIFVWAHSIDATNVISITAQAKNDYFQEIKTVRDDELKRYERELGLVDSTFGEAGGGAASDGSLKSRVNNSYGVDFNNPNNMKILNRIKAAFRDDRGDGKGISLTEIGAEFSVSKEIPSRIRKAAIEEGIYDPEENKRKHSERIGDAA